MVDTDQAREILALRERKLTPKQIARKLSLKPSEVSRWLRDQAQQVEIDRRERGELAPLVGCYADSVMVADLYGEAQQEDDDFGLGGLGTVCVVREARGERLSFWVFLVDYYCLGLKNMFGPRTASAKRLESALSETFKAHAGQYDAIALEQARELIYGSIEFARQFGFEPASEFADTRQEALGEWDGKCSLTFGKDGKPFFISGPYDNSNAVLQKLERHAGSGNYHYIAGMDALDLDGI